MLRMQRIHQSPHFNKLRSFIADHLDIYVLIWNKIGYLESNGGFIFHFFPLNCTVPLLEVGVCVCEHQSVHFCAGLHFCCVVRRGLTLPHSA